MEFHEAFEGAGRKEFFKKVSLISVPVRNGEAFGMYLLESMASGIPVVQPSLGAFPEIISLSGGGIVYQPNTPEELSGINIFRKASIAIKLNNKVITTNQPNKPHSVCHN